MARISLKQGFVVREGGGVMLLICYDPDSIPRRSEPHANNYLTIKDNLVARERYIASPTHFERLFSKTYRAA
jgi:hypothetical protein